MNPLVQECLMELLAEGELERTGLLLQHGNTTVLEHSIRVAETALVLALRLRLKVNERSMIRGALLHDYNLYNWREEKGRVHYFHGFLHPYIALKNARRDYEVNRIEENIIVRHMFPLTPIPPSCRESWLVTAADKICASAEFSKSASAKLKHRLNRNRNHK